MQKQIQPSKIHGVISAPASKSMMQRAVAAGLLADGITTIYNPSICNDTLAAIDIAKKLGATIETFDDKIKILGGKVLRSNQLNCGESGLAVRMFSSIASLYNEAIHFEGEGSLLKRPISMISNALSQLGVLTTSNNGFLPLSIQGPMKGGVVNIDGSISSQLLTGLLMILPCADMDSTIFVKDLKSKPYIDMTIQLLNDFGIDITNKNYKTFEIKGKQQYIAREFTVEGDWSSAAFLLVAGAIAGKISVKGLSLNSAQSDMRILDALHDAEAIVKCDDTQITTEKTALKSFEFDATECPDLFPPLVALAAFCKGTSIINGTERLSYKESDRATALMLEFAKMGIEIKINKNKMYVTGGTIQSAFVESHNDHRIAMATTIAALGSNSTITINNTECVAKSYPTFFKDIESVGGIIYEMPT